MKLALHVSVTSITILLILPVPGSHRHKTPLYYTHHLFRRYICYELPFHDDQIQGLILRASILHLHQHVQFELPGYNDDIQIYNDKI